MTPVHDSQLPTGRPRHGLASVAAAVCLLHCAPLAAQRVEPDQAGSLPLTEVLALAKPYPNLVNEIRLQLIAANLTKDAVACTGARYSNAWVTLGGRRLAPYTCAIGERRLAISATQLYRDRIGHRLLPTDPALPVKAARFSEHRLKWTWQ